MDALEFINERDRMCATSENCNACLANRKGCIFNYPANNTAKEQVKVLEEWAAVHPRKTRQSVFLEQYPLAKRNCDSVLVICPQALYANFSCPYEKSNDIECSTCKREFWFKEVE